MQKSIFAAALPGPNSIFVQSVAGNFASHDRGQTWHRASPFSRQAFSTRIATVRGSIYALSQDGALFSSRDNGATWVERQGRSGLTNISSSGNDLYACAGDGRTVLKWNASSAGWFPVGRAISPPESGYQNGPACDQVHVAGRRITAYGNATYSHSRDGGRTWRPVVAPSYPHPYLADGETGLHADGRGVLYSTRVTRTGTEPISEAYFSQTGGRSWRPLPTRIVGDLAGRRHRVERVVGSDLYLMPMPDFDHRPAALYRTRGGQPAEMLIDLTAHRKLGSYLQFQASAKTLVIAMGDGLLISADDGATWRELSTLAISAAHEAICH
jgi:photosystem II stability/assembly factor-like uncharacterized protein